MTWKILGDVGATYLSTKDENMKVFSLGFVFWFPRHLKQYYCAVTVTVPVAETCGNKYTSLSS